MATDNDLIKVLGDQLEAERPALDRIDTYLSNKPLGPLGFIAPEVRAQVGQRLNPVVINYPRLVVGAVEERLDVVGFARAGDADPDLWATWQRNRMDVGSQQAHAAALAYGRCPVIVWSAGEPGTVKVTTESPRQVAVAYAPGNGEPTSAVKRWVEDGYGRAVLFLPDRVVNYRSKAQVVEWGGTVPVDGWVATGTVPNRLGVVPVVELVNRAKLVGGGESELVDVLPISDAIAKLATDLMTSSEFSSMPRRWVTGLQLPEDPDTGEPDAAAAFDMTAGRTWFAEEDTARMGQFAEANLEGYVRGVEMLVQQLASVSSIPAHYLNSLTGQLPSAESLRSAEASLVAKVKRKQTGFGDAWERVARLVWLVRDGRLPDGGGELSTMWADPESRTDAMAADAALKRAELGVPWAQLMADLGYTPAQVESMRAMKRTEAIDGQGVDLSLLTEPVADDAA